MKSKENPGRNFFCRIFLNALPYLPLERQERVGIGLLIQRDNKIWGYNLVAGKFEPDFCQQKYLPEGKSLNIFIEEARSEEDLFKKRFFLHFRG